MKRAKPLKWKGLAFIQKHYHDTRSLLHINEKEQINIEKQLLFALFCDET